MKKCMILKRRPNQVCTMVYRKREKKMHLDDAVRVVYHRSDDSDVVGHDLRFALGNADQAARVLREVELAPEKTINIEVTWHYVRL